ncbi:twin-arginine translocation signal domain-containing protein [uncultured Methylibium sp.]|uniref:twin-arginine translocation signal domain-containing protein n=1 Tax=uncultured Methylibium sp. TaxID=381093 RepID=UPI0025EE5380|nr:twin-arginine translocation signal domain-containing protein [uncultured Methylibium sp.]
MKIVPILGDAVAFASCDDAPASAPKLPLPLARREFLKGSGVLIGSLAVGSPLAALAPSTVWAVELKTLSKAEGEALMKLGRTLYPHRKLPDAVYALLAKDLDGAASSDPATATLLREGIAGLNRASGGFARANEAKRLAAVKAIEGSPFFGKVRGQCVTSLYDNDMAFTALGYPGSAWEKGGYITRGFQDLKWLPAPPEAASPKPYFG